VEQSFPVGRTAWPASLPIQPRRTLLPLLAPRALPLVVAPLLVALLAAVGCASAQEPPAPGFYYGGLLGATHDDNVFRTSSANGTNSDWITTYGLLGGYDRTFSRTRLYANATVSRVNYRDLSQLDYTQQDLAGGVGTNLPGDINAALDLTRNVALARFADTNNTRRNLISRTNALVSVDAPIATDWRVLVGGGPSRLRDSNATDQVADLNTTDLNAGVRYQSALGNRVDFLLRRDKARYVLEQTGPFALPDYHETAAEVRAVWTLSGASRINGRVGYVKRKNDGRPDLDFSGPAYDITYTWTPTVLSTVQLFALRERGAAGDALLQSAKSTTYRLTPSLLVGTRITLRGVLELSERSYYGADPTLNLNRKDTVRAIGLGAGWTPERWLTLDVDFRHENRSSPLAGFDYKSNVGRVTGQARF
jgi:hypothetical protein